MLVACGGRVVEPVPPAVEPAVEPAFAVARPLPKPAEPIQRKPRDEERARAAQRAEAARRAEVAARLDSAKIERQIAEHNRGANVTERRLLQHLEEWQGVPYRYGGMSRSGIDCSGFVALTFRTQFGIHLPRTTAAQIKEGKFVERTKLQAGDLVFFRPERNRRHVGIYLSDGEFIHSGTSLGVGKSSLDNPYWAKRYLQARRVPQRGR